jgi:hypothetical protein
MDNDNRKITEFFTPKQKTKTIKTKFLQKPKVLFQMKLTEYPHYENITKYLESGLYVI